jgi:hypothetical protein
VLLTGLSLPRAELVTVRLLTECPQPSKFPMKGFVVVPTGGRM